MLSYINIMYFYLIGQLFYDVLSVLDPALHVRNETPLTKQEEASKESVVQCEGPIQETFPKTTASQNSPV